MSAFESLEIGKKGIIAYQQGMSVVGHNLSNIGTKGYSRQKITFGTSSPLYKPALNRAQREGQIGQGVLTVSIKRVKDEILEGRIDSLSSGEQFHKTKEKYLGMLSNLYNEPEDASIRKAMDGFWNSLSNLSIHPSEQGSKQEVVQTAKTLTDSITKRYSNLKNIKDMVETELKENVGRVNEFLNQIGDLSKRIKTSLAEGDNPNDLLDKRDILVESLGKIIPITVDKRDNQFKISMDGYGMALDDSVAQLEMKPNPDNEGYVNLYFKNTGEEFSPSSGSLGALVSLRDGDVREEIDSLDNMTINLVSNVNDIHRKGFNQEGQTGTYFFKEFPFVNNQQGNYDSTGDGNFDSTYLFSVKGTNSLKISDQIGMNGTLTLAGKDDDINIDYKQTDTIRDIILKINHSDAQINASLDNDGKLILKSTASENTKNPDFVLRNFSDSGDFLVGYSGILKQGQTYDFANPNATDSLQGSFSVAPITHPAAYFGLTDSIKNNASKVASSKNGSAGDGSIAIAIANLRNNDIMLGKTASFDDYFADSVANIGIKQRENITMGEEKELVLKDLKDYRDSISGVNINEEISDMMKFQHGYNASARFVVTVDKMIDTIMGLVT